MANNNNIRLGPANVTFSGTLGGVSYTNLDLGASSTDGVTIAFSSDVINVSTDRTGSAPARVFLAGQGAEITTNLIEETFDNIYLSVPGAVSGTGNRIDYGRSAGYDLVANWAGRLIITPLDTSRRKFEFYSCTPAGNPQFNYNSADPFVLTLVWRAVPVGTLADGKQLGYSLPQS